VLWPSSELLFLAQDQGWLNHSADIVMPDAMNGVELAERLRRARSELKVIYRSGYLADLSPEDISRHANATSPNHSA
jgi:hypothetical protein